MIKGWIQTFINLFGYQVNKIETIAGNPFLTTKFLIKNKNPVIFDIGAHIGQTTKKYLSLFPSSHIYAFEPFTESFNELEDKFGNLESVRVFHIGFGESAGIVSFYSNAFSETNSLLSSDKRASKIWGFNKLETKDIVQVKLEKLDDFLESNDIGFVDILKLDAQGAELDIIKGAGKSLLSNKIGLIYCEIIIMPTYENQGKLADYLKVLDDLGFSLYNFYNYSYLEGQLRQVDAIFLNKKLYDKLNLA